MKVKFISLASGSSGNCYYIGTEKYGILIDAGIAVRTIKKGLKEAGISMEMIRAVFVTHDHADHIKAVGGLGEKLNIPIYTTARIHEGINRSYCMTEKLYSSVRYLEKQQPMQLEDFHIESFEVPHDGTDNVGYCIEIGGKVFAFLTDLGEITPTAAEYIRKANYLILEANYDEEMLRMGTYPQYLKERITSRTGHMSNIATAEMKGAAIADKVIGKGAAALMVLGGFKTVYADIISTPALALLCEAGIETTFAQEVPHIINRDKTGWCPLETACMELNTVEEMYPVIQNFISRIRAK